MLSESERLDRQIEEVQTHLEQLPEGSLICARIGSYYKWYHYNGAALTYIPKKQRMFAEQLAVKKYLMCLQKELLAEQKITQAIFRSRFHARKIEGK